MKYLHTSIEILLYFSILYLHAYEKIFRTTDHSICLSLSLTKTFQAPPNSTQLLWNPTFNPPPCHLSDLSIQRLNTRNNTAAQTNASRTRVGIRCTACARLRDWALSAACRVFFPRVSLFLTSKTKNMEITIFFQTWILGIIATIIGKLPNSGWMTRIMANQLTPPGHVHHPRNTGLIRPPITRDLVTAHLERSLEQTKKIYPWSLFAREKRLGPIIP